MSWHVFIVRHYHGISRLNLDKNRHSFLLIRYPRHGWIIGLILELQRFISLIVYSLRRKKAEKCYVSYYAFKRHSASIME